MIVAEKLQNDGALRQNTTISPHGSSRSCVTTPGQFTLSPGST
jgi:hypothetical protein